MAGSLGWGRAGCRGQSQATIVASTPTIPIAIPRNATLCRVHQEVLSLKGCPDPLCSCFSNLESSRSSNRAAYYRAVIRSSAATSSQPSAAGRGDPTGRLRRALACLRNLRRSGAVRLYTEDLNHGQKILGVEVFNPFLVESA